MVTRRWLQHRQARGSRRREGRQGVAASYLHSHTIGSDEDEGVHDEIASGGDADGVYTLRRGGVVVWTWAGVVVALTCLLHLSAATFPTLIFSAHTKKTATFTPTTMKTRAAMAPVVSAHSDNMREWLEHGWAGCKPLHGQLASDTPPFCHSFKHRTVVLLTSPLPTPRTVTRSLADPHGNCSYSLQLSPPSISASNSSPSLRTSERQFVTVKRIRPNLSQSNGFVPCCIGLETAIPMTILHQVDISGVEWCIFSPSKRLESPLHHLVM